MFYPLFSLSELPDRFLEFNLSLLRHPLEYLYYILINEESKEKKEKFILDSENNKLPDTVIKTLKLQNFLIKNFENNEEKLRIKIVDLEQDISLLNNKKNKQ